MALLNMLRFDPVFWDFLPVSRCVVASPDQGSPRFRRFWRRNRICGLQEIRPLM